MRPSEYLGLKWQDIDWARQTVSVVRSIRKLNGKWCFSDTKRLRSRRPIKLQRWIVSLLHDLHTKVSAQDLYPEARDLIFTTPSGEPISADYLAKHFRSIIDLAGVPRLRLYDLRHSAATLALAAGVSPKVVSEQLRTREHGLYVGYLCSRSSTHAGRGCCKSRGNALWSDGLTTSYRCRRGTRYDQDDVRLDASGTAVKCAIPQIRLVRMPTIGVHGDKRVSHYQCCETPQKPTSGPLCLAIARICS